jgi:hypothetical protein
MPGSFKVAKLATLGTGTTKTQIHGAADFRIPEWARVINGIRWYGGLLTLTADEGLIVKGTIESSDLAIAPCEMIALQQGSMEATTACQPPVEQVYYPLNIPCRGGEALQLYGTCLRANTVAPGLGAVVYLGTSGFKVRDADVEDPLPNRQRYYKAGTLTAAVAARATGTAYTITNAKAVTAVMGAVNKDTQDDSKPVVGYFELESPAFGLSPVEFATDAGLSYKVTRRQCNIPVNDYVCIVQDYYNQELGTAITTDDWITCVEFVK